MPIRFMNQRINFAICVYCKRMFLSNSSSFYFLNQWKQISSLQHHILVGAFHFLTIFYIKLDIFATIILSNNFGPFQKRNRLAWFVNVHHLLKWEIELRSCFGFVSSIIPFLSLSFWWSAFLNFKNLILQKNHTGFFS